MKTCKVDGCNEPRYGRHAYCRQHRNEQQRIRRRRAQMQSKPSNICWLCNRTPEQAAIWAAMNVTCTGCNVKPAALRRPATKADKQAGGVIVAYPSYPDNQVQYLRAVVDHTEPMPSSDGALCELLEQAASKGYLVAQKDAFKW